LEEEEILVVPPFSFTSFSDLLNATYGWIRYRLTERQPDLVEEVEIAYRNYTHLSINEMAETFAAEQGIKKQDALVILQAAHARGNLSLTLSHLHLLKFFEVCVTTCQKTGYKGLLVLPDEIQNYVNADTRPDLNLRNLFELVTGLQTRREVLGMIFGLPSYTRDVIVDKRDDLLQRIKDNNLYLDLETLYGEAFPEAIWTQYGRKFRLGDQKDRIIDQYALRSIGQIAFRREKDLGNGPRTVVNALRESIRHFRQSGNTYSPIDFIDDYLKGNIKFDGRHSLLVEVVQEALRSDIVDTPEKERAVKLLAAFPKGCAEEVYKHYSLRKPIEELLRRGQGTLIIYTVDGFTLSGLKEAALRCQVSRHRVHFFQLK
jgi:hypothetical protein